LNPEGKPFQPNFFVNISEYLEKKIEILNTYESEVGTFPFPRSEKSVRALASYRGATAGVEAAEAFMLLKEVF
jgi:LmbE family N-acetylglucosaminyl deacetylase